MDKRLKTFFVILIVFLITSCSNSNFEKEMRKSKDYLISEDYESAIKHLEIASIENPKDTDIPILMDKAIKGKNKKEALENINKYVEENLNYVQGLEKLQTEINVIDLNTPVSIINERMERIKEIEKGLDKVKSKWKSIPNISKIHDIFIGSVESYYKYHDTVLKSIQNEGGVLNRYSMAKIFLESYGKQISEYHEEVGKLQHISP